MANLRSRGYKVDRTERWVLIRGRTGIKVDLFHWIDLLGASPSAGLIAVQTFYREELNSHLRNYADNTEFHDWLALVDKSQGLIRAELHSWFRPGIQGRPWELEIIELNPRVYRERCEALPPQRPRKPKPLQHSGTTLETVSTMSLP